MPPELQVRRTVFWGLAGESEIVGKPSGRIVQCFIVLHQQFNTPKKLLDELNKLDDLVGEHGTLEETGEVPQKYKHCTFEGFERTFNGQQHPGPLKNDAGTLFDESGDRDFGYFQTGVLRWRQLRVD